METEADTETKTSADERRKAGAARLLAELGERGRLTAVQARDATGLPEAAAKTLIRDLVADARVRARGQGRARTYALPR